MANPTLLASETPYSGFTLAQIVERLLSSFGLSEDSTNTKKTPASTTDQTNARVFVRRAVNVLVGKFPSIWSIREVSSTWVSGDHSVLTPANCRTVIDVLWDGLPLTPITHDDRMRLLRPNDAVGAETSPKTGSEVLFWFISGVTSAQRTILRLVSTPGEAKSYTVIYTTLAPELTNDAAALPMMLQFQEWVLAQARQLFAEEIGDTVQLGLATAAMKRIEDDLRPDVEGMEEPRRLKWRYPNQAGRFHRGK